MESHAPDARVVAASFDHFQVFASPFLDQWNAPSNPFLAALVPLLRPHGVQMSDFAYNASAQNLGQVELSIELRKFDATVRISLDSARYSTWKPNWHDDTELLRCFGSIAETIEHVATASPSFQTSTVKFHVAPGPYDFGRAMESHVKIEALGNGEFFGVSRHRHDSMLLIDRSPRNPSWAFVHFRRDFAGDTRFADLPIPLYADMVEALTLLGVRGIS